MQPHRGIVSVMPQNSCCLSEKESQTFQLSHDCTIHNSCHSCQGKYIASKPATLLSNFRSQLSAVQALSYLNEWEMLSSQFYVMINLSGLKKKRPWKWSDFFHNCLGWWLKVCWGSSHNYHSFFWSTIHNVSYFTLHSLLGFIIFVFKIYILYLTEVLVIVKKGQRRTPANRK